MSQYLMNTGHVSGLVTDKEGEKTMIDWNFIHRMEGNPQVKGYVPDSQNSQSGVTIATGVDLGQRSADDLEKMDIPDSLKVKLAPYTGLKKQKAVDYLAAHPLVISKEEADMLDVAVRAPFIRQLEQLYDAETGKYPGTAEFATLPSAIQTAIASVAFQYGSNLAKRAPKFWSLVTRHDWVNCICELQNFGDAYENRRRSEAELIQNGLTARKKT